MFSGAWFYNVDILFSCICAGLFFAIKNFSNFIGLLFYHNFPINETKVAVYSAMRAFYTSKL